jgi:sulfofructosephosphate aldolase
MTNGAPSPLDALRLASGGFAMVALDQRESLRTILAERTGLPATDADLSAFKVAAARALSDTASAVLLDREYGLEPVLSAAALSPAAGLIVAVDRLAQEQGGPVEDTDLDDLVDDEALAALAAGGAVALKLLVLWRRPGDPRLAATVDRFLGACRRSGLASVLEGIVRPEDGRVDREDAILRAAGELGGRGPDLYKAEVPCRGRADPDEIRQRAAAMTAELPCPWVVLSNGVERDDFPAGVRAACRGGASGFLAGRAVWTDSIEPPSPGRRWDDGLEERLRERALGRLRELRSIVEAETAGP